MGKNIFFSMLLVSALSCFLTGCGHSEGIIVSNAIIAEEYMTDNEKLIEKYGPDYSFKRKGMSDSGEVDRHGTSGNALATFLVNDTDIYYVTLHKEKNAEWKVTGMIEKAKYTCDEFLFMVDLDIQNNLMRDSISNGRLEYNGEEIEVIATLGNTLQIYDKAIWDDHVAGSDNPNLMFTAEWADESLLFICDVELDFDSFIATVRPEYQDLFYSDLQQLHFRRSD